METATLPEVAAIAAPAEKSPATDLDATGKQVVLHQLARFSDDAPLDEIIEQLRLTAAVREGLASVARGEAMPMGEFKKQMATWDFS